MPGLVNGKTYRFRVSARTEHGTGPAAGPTNAVTIGVPTAPVSVTAVARAGKAEVRWKAPSTTNGSAITAYVVTPYRDGVAAPARVLSAHSTKAEIAGLAAGRSYTFRVAAENHRGTGPQSSASNAVVAAGRTLRGAGAATAQLVPLTDCVPGVVLGSRVTDRCGRRATCGFRDKGPRYYRYYPHELNAGGRDGASASWNAQAGDRSRGGNGADRSSGDRGALPTGRRRGRWHLHDCGDRRGGRARRRRSRSCGRPRSAARRRGRRARQHAHRRLGQQRRARGRGLGVESRLSARGLRGRLQRGPSARSTSSPGIISAVTTATASQPPPRSSLLLPTSRSTRPATRSSPIH